MRKKGLIRSERKENGYRLYNENDLAALISIKYRRHMNHSIGDIEKDLIGSNFSIENMKNLTEAAIITEGSRFLRGPSGKSAGRKTLPGYWQIGLKYRR